MSNHFVNKLSNLHIKESSMSREDKNRTQIFKNGKSIERWTEMLFRPIVIIGWYLAIFMH